MERVFLRLVCRPPANPVFCVMRKNEAGETIAFLTAKGWVKPDEHYRRDLKIVQYSFEITPENLDWIKENANHNT